MIRTIKNAIPPIIKKTSRKTVKNVWNSLQYTQYVKPTDQRKFKHIVFVCKGNICRSPFAEYYFRSNTNHLPFEVESFGLDVNKKCRSPKEAIETSMEFNVNLTEHWSTPISASNLSANSLILPMDFSHFLQLIELFPDLSDNIMLLRKFCSWPSNLLCNIDDPYGQDNRVFRNCFDLISDAIDVLISRLILQQR